MIIKKQITPTLTSKITEAKRAASMEKQNNAFCFIVSIPNISSFYCAKCEVFI